MRASQLTATGLTTVAIAMSLAADAEELQVYGRINEGIDTTRVVGGNNFDPVRVMVLYQRTDTGALAEDGFGVSVAWKFGKETAKVQYLSADIWRTDPQVDPLDNLLENLLTVGLDHELAKGTRLFAFYTTGDIGGTSESNDYAAIGIEHKF